MIRASHRQWPRSLGARSRAARHVRAACGLWSTPRRGGGGAAKAPRRRRRGGGIAIAASRRRRRGGGGGAATAVAARRRRDPRVASAAAAVARVPLVTCARACGPRRIAAAAVRRRRRGGGVVVTMSRRRRRGGGEVAAAARWRRDPRLASAAPRHQRGWDRALALLSLGHSALRGAAAHLLWWYGESEAERCVFNPVYWPAQLIFGSRKGSLCCCSMMGVLWVFIAFKLYKKRETKRNFRPIEEPHASTPAVRCRSGRAYPE